MRSGPTVVLGLAAAVLCAWFLWPRVAPSTPALEPLAPETRSESVSTEIEADEIVNPTAEPERATDETNAVEAVQAEPKAEPALAPDTIVGIVLRGKKRGRQPVVGAPVTLHAISGTDDTRPVSERPQVAATYTGTDGTFRFTGIEPGHYVVRALDGNSAREGRTRVLKRKPSPRVVLVFGTSSIHGTVYELDGKPLSGCTLRLEYTTAFNRTSTPSTLCAFSTTDAEGKYAFGELAPDTYSLVLARAGKEWTDGWPGRTWTLRTAETQELVLDAGTEHGADHWTGALRRRNGTLVQETRHVALDCEVPAGKGVLEIWVESGSSSTGEFDFPLEPGTWLPIVDLSPWGREARSVERCVVPVGGLHQDLVVP